MRAKQPICIAQRERGLGFGNKGGESMWLRGGASPNP